MLKISIIEGHNQPQSRTTKNGVRYYQNAYAHFGGAFPQEIEVPLRSAADAFPVGDYELDIRNFRVGRFKNLEINPFELTLTPLDKGQKASASSASKAA